MINRRQFLAAGSALCVLVSLESAEAGEIVRVAALASGTVAWEIDTIIHHGFDKRHGIQLAMVPVAGNKRPMSCSQAGRRTSSSRIGSGSRAKGTRAPITPFSLIRGKLAPSSSKQPRLRIVCPISGIEKLALPAGLRIKAGSCCVPWP